MICCVRFLGLVGVSRKSLFFRGTDDYWMFGSMIRIWLEIWGIEDCFFFRIYWKRRTFFFKWEIFSYICLYLGFSDFERFSEYIYGKFYSESNLAGDRVYIVVSYIFFIFIFTFILCFNFCFSFLIYVVLLDVIKYWEFIVKYGWVINM